MRMNLLTKLDLTLKVSKDEAKISCFNSPLLPQAEGGISAQRS